MSVGSYQFSCNHTSKRYARPLLSLNFFEAQVYSGGIKSSTEATNYEVKRSVATGQPPCRLAPPAEVRGFYVLDFDHYRSRNVELSPVCALKIWRSVRLASPRSCLLSNCPCTMLYAATRISSCQIHSVSFPLDNLNQMVLFLCWVISQVALPVMQKMSPELEPLGVTELHVGPSIEPVIVEHCTEACLNA